MKIPQELMVKALEEGKILPYEEDLVKRLRELTYRGFPLSIVLFCREFCRGECYSMSMNISRGMDKFRLVHGDVNFIVLNDKYPNHSWVEKDGFVYDTTDGFRWDKDLYYELFKPVVREVYTEETVGDYSDYQRILSHSNDEVDPLQLQLMIQYIELLETESPYVNCRFLQNEIDIWREKNKITERFSDEAMDEYKKILAKLKNS